MNAQAQFLTITPEQLQKFEADKHAIQSELTDTLIMFDQLSTLFKTIEELGEEGSGALMTKIQGLSGLGEHVCKGLSDSIPDIQNSIDALSPLETVKA